MSESKAKKPATLKDIANIAGVTPATISYVLNNTGSVSEETRLRVEKAIDETEYRSNLLARNLRLKRTKLIGVLVEDVTVWHTAFIIDGINEAAEKNGYNTILSNMRLLSKIESSFETISSYQKDFDKALNILLGMKVDGIIYVGMHDRKLPHVLHVAEEMDIPVVYCYSYTDDHSSFVRYSNYETIYEMTEKLIQLNHGSIACMLGTENSEPNALRFAGFKKALEKHQIQLCPDYVVRGNWSYQGGVEAAKKLLTNANPPTAIVAFNDEMAIGVYDVAKRLGFNIPEDLSVTGFDNAAIIQHISPHLVTAERPLQAMGIKSVEVLLRRLEENDEKDTCQRIVLPCKIIEGESITLKGRKV